MFYTESFLNENTCLGKEHMWHFKITWHETECLFCCVCENKFDRKVDEVEAVLKAWFYCTLLCSLEKGAVEIQRELNRFVVWLVKWNKAEEDVKPPVLYLYIQGNLYLSITNEAVFAKCRGHRGVIWSKDDETDKMRAGDMEVYLREYLAEDINFANDLKHCDTYVKTVEETANRLKRDMLVAMSRGTLKQGYFIIWEAEDDFQTGR